MSALFLKDLAQKTHRGQRGRIEAGKSAGGLCYGYGVVRRLDERGEPYRICAKPLKRWLLHHRPIPRDDNCRTADDVNWPLDWGPGDRRHRPHDDAGAERPIARQRNARIPRRCRVQPKECPYPHRLPIHRYRPHDRGELHRAGNRPSRRRVTDRGSTSDLVRDRGAGKRAPLASWRGSGRRWGVDLASDDHAVFALLPWSAAPSLTLYSGGRPFDP